MVDTYVAHSHVFDWVTGDASNDRSVSRIGVIDDDVADRDTPQSTDFGRLFRSTPTRSQPEEKGRISDIAHHNIIDRYAFEQTAVNRHESEAPGVVKDAIRDCYIPETAVGFSAKLYPTSRKVTPPLTVKLAPVVNKLAFVCTIERCAFIITAEIAVRDGYILSRLRMTEREGAFQTKGVVERRVDVAIRDMHVPASINVNAIAIRIYLHVVDGQIVNARREYAKVATMQ